MTIENARLGALLAEEERRETSRQSTGRVAHIISTRVAVIAGTVSRLRSFLIDENGLQNWFKDITEQNLDLFMKSIPPMDAQLASMIKEYYTALTLRNLSSIDPGSTPLRTRFVDDTRLYLDRLAKGIQMAQQVLKEFQKFSKPSELRTEPLNVVDLLNSVLDETQDGTCTILREYSGSPLMIEGDKQELLDGFTELIRNAQQMMHIRGINSPEIRIMARSEKLRAYLLVGGGEHFREATIEALVHPRQSEMEQMIKPGFAPAHPHSFEALLNQPFASALH